MNSDCALQAYARYAQGRAAVVLVNTGDKEQTFTAAIPFDELGLSSDVTASELLRGSEVTRRGDTLCVSIPPRDVAVVLLEKM